MTTFDERMKELKDDAVRYPYLVVEQLSEILTKMKTDNKTYKRTSGSSTKIDRYRALLRLKSHVEYILDND